MRDRRGVGGRRVPLPPPSLPRWGCLSVLSLSLSLSADTHGLEMPFVPSVCFSFLLVHRLSCCFVFFLFSRCLMSPSCRTRHHHRHHRQRQHHSLCRPLQKAEEAPLFPPSSVVSLFCSLDLSLFFFSSFLFVERIVLRSQKARRTRKRGKRAAEVGRDARVRFALLLTRGTAAAHVLSGSPGLPPPPLNLW